MFVCLSWSILSQTELIHTSTSAAAMMNRKRMANSTEDATIDSHIYLQFFRKMPSKRIESHGKYLLEFSQRKFRRKKILREKDLFIDVSNLIAVRNHY